MIVYVNTLKARQVTFSEYAKMSKEIANNPQLDKYINIDSKTKEMFEKT
jgi:hypothetical protein